MKSRAKELRQRQTDVEFLLWPRLKNRQLNGNKFRRQHIIKPYIVDFICLEKNLIIELDGGQHSTQINYDQQRTQHLQQRGYRVIRFWNNDVMINMEGVLSEILRFLVI